MRGKEENFLRKVFFLPPRPYLFFKNFWKIKKSEYGAGKL